MKNAKTYARRIRKLLGRLRKVSPLGIPPGPERVRAMLRGILQADTTRKQAERALETLVEEYVDLNELRVSPTKDIIDCIGRDFPGAREKAESIATVLNNVFARTNDISIDFMEAVPKREVRRHLSELGLGPYAAAYAAMTIFALPAIPVDWTLAACLELDGCVAPGSNIAQVRALLERIVPPEDVPAAHETLKTYAEKQAKVYAKKIRPEPVAAPTEPTPVSEQSPAKPVAAARAVQALPQPNARQPKKSPAKAPAATAANPSQRTGKRQGKAKR
jgi:endonuclease III